MFKKLVVCLCLVSLLGLQAAAATSSIGYIEVQKVFKQYKGTEKAQKELDKKQKAFQKEFEESQKKLLKAEKDGKDKSDLEKMRKDLEKKLEPKRKELLKLNQELTTKLQGKILAASNKVIKKLGLEMIVDKQVVIVGGMDVTDMVISELNK